MSIAKFQRILKGVICPLIAVAWTVKIAVLREPIDPSTIVIIGGFLGIRWIGNGSDDG